MLFNFKNFFGIFEKFNPNFEKLKNVQFKNVYFIKKEFFNVLKFYTLKFFFNFHVIFKFFQDFFKLKICALKN